MKTLLTTILLAFGLSSHATTKTDVKQKSKEAGETALEYTKEQKDAFIKEMEGNINDVKAEINELKTKASSKTDEKVKLLETKQKNLEADLDKLKKSTGRAWIKVREGAVSAWAQLQQSLSEAKKELTN